jgi:uncharacterized membrane protein YoaK (UPF0700 family)
MSTQPRLLHPAGYLPADNADAERWRSQLPHVLSTIAGMVDVIGFLSLGRLFTAHVTGNLVVIAALLVRGGPPNVAQILAVPVFIAAVAAVSLMAKAFGKRGAALARPLLLVQFLLLSGVLMISLIYRPAANPHGLMAGLAAMIAVSAMACQFALLRLALPGAPSTAVMTGNLTNTVLSLLDVLSPSDPLIEGSSERLKKTLYVLGGFFAGCVAGAAGVSRLGEWAWLLPVAVAGMAVGLAPRSFGSPKVSFSRSAFTSK